MESDILQDYRANLGEWWNGISQITGVLVINAPESFFGSYFFSVDDDTLWIFCDGVFFLAKRTAALSR